mgnify:CR=1 FL=1
MISRWTDCLTSGGEKDDRNRDQEFIDDIFKKADLVDTWEKGWNVLFRTLGGLKEQDLLKGVTIRGESHSVLDAIERQLAHYSYHVGQMVYVGKQLKGENGKTSAYQEGNQKSI